MLRATRIDVAEPAGAADDIVILDWDRRHRRRLQMTTRGGTEFVLDLPGATALRSGDRLVLDDGRRVTVEAAAERLAEIAAPDAAALVRIAWHLGNRHLPTQLLGETLRIRTDHVIEEMVRGLGGQVRAVTGPFDPEGGAYGHGHVEGHSHGTLYDHGDHGGDGSARGHAHAHDVRPGERGDRVSDGRSGEHDIAPAGGPATAGTGGRHGG